MTPERLVSWLFDRWRVEFGADGYMRRWSPSAQFEAMAHGPLACILYVRDANGLDHVTSGALESAYEAARDGRIVQAARNSERKEAGR